MHLARLAGLDHQARLRARALADQVMMHGGGGQQAGDRRLVLVHAAVGEDQDRAALAHRLGGRFAQLVERLLQPASPSAALNSIGSVTDSQIADADLAQLRQVGVAQDRRLSLIRCACLRRLFQQVALAAEVREQRRHQLLEVRIQRRVGHLREELLEIVVEQLRPSLRQASGVSVPIEPIASCAVDGHRRHEDDRRSSTV